MIDVVMTAAEASTRVDAKATAVIIDVLRATSVMATAMNNGAKNIIAVQQPEEAFALKQKLGCLVVLGGERNADKIAGFDFGNSPLEYTADSVANRIVVMTTSNGTRALLNSKLAKRVLLASFINVKAIVDVLKNEENITIVCAGTNDTFSIEDALCAGLIVNMVGQKHQLTDAAICVRELYKSCNGDPQQLASQGKHYNVLVSKGYADSLDCCFSSNDEAPALEWIDGRVSCI